MPGNLHFPPKLNVPATLFPKHTTNDNRSKNKGASKRKKKAMEIKFQDQQREGSKLATGHTKSWEYSRK